MNKITRSNHTHMATLKFFLVILVLTLNGCASISRSLNINKQGYFVFEALISKHMSSLIIHLLEMIDVDDN